jgi:hypothetical protein
VLEVTIVATGAEQLQRAFLRSKAWRRSAIVSFELLMVLKEIN